MEKVEEVKDLSCYTYSINMLITVVAKDEKEALERVDSGLGYLVDKKIILFSEEKLNSLPK